MTNTPAGWYPDPYDPRQLRWWDGSQWTDSTHPMEQGAQQPVQQAPEAQPTAQYGSPSGYPEQQGPYTLPGQWGGGGGGTAQLPMPDFGSQPQRNSALPWVLGGVAILAALGLILGGTLFFLNRANDQPVARDVTTAPTAPSVPTPEFPASPQPSAAAPQSPMPRPQPSDGRISDPVTGLSYAYPGKPWEVLPGDYTPPSDPTVPAYSSGYMAVSMAAYDGKKGNDWVGSVYAFQLPAAFDYRDSSDLEIATATVFNAYEPDFYSPQHTRKILRNEALTVSGHPAWLTEFEMDFTAQSEVHKWKWKKERGAFVLVDRGQSERPSMLYVSVPDNLDQSVIKQVLDSLEAR